MWRLFVFFEENFLTCVYDGVSMRWSSEVTSDLQVSLLFSVVQGGSINRKVRMMRRRGMEA